MKPKASLRTKDILRLNKEEKNPKKKDQLLEEKDELEAELQRAMTVVGVKKVHKEIEDTEKARKRSAVQSIHDRLDALISSLGIVTEKLQQIPNSNPKVFSMQ